MDFTGERYVPGIGGSIALESEHRYRFCLNLVKERKVLDIACGEGFGSAMMAERATDVFGVDIDAAAIAHAEQTYKRANLHFLQGSCAAIPLANGSVDVVVSFETIEHHDAHEAMIEEVRRVLRPGGALVISSPDKRIYSEVRNFHNKFHVKELYAEEFSALIKKYFTYVSMFGQRMVYGSALLLQDGFSQIQSYGFGSQEPVPGLKEPIYLLAIASDDPSWAKLGYSGLFEDTVYRSEEIVERTLAGERQADELRLLIEDLKAQADSHRQLALRRWEDLQALRDQQRRHYYSASVARRMAFHRSGRPRGWLRSILLKDPKLGSPRMLFRRLLFKKNGQVRPIFREWFSTFNAKRAAFAQQDYVNFLRAQISSGALAKANTLHIVTTPHCEFIGELIAAALGHTRLEITHSLSIGDRFNHDLYIVVSPQMFEILPPASRTIMVQVEQVRASNWVDEAYLSRLKSSIAVLDYSRDNIAALVERGMPSKQIYYMPILPLGKPGVVHFSNINRDIDVLFYGSIASERRQHYIAALAERVNIRVETNLFGPSLRELLNRSKVVVNVHFYENALLETTRVSEALSHGARVVSEEAIDHVERKNFEGLVDFVPAGEVNAFVERVEAVLAEWTQPAISTKNEDLSGTSFHVLRALNGCGVISLKELDESSKGMNLPSNRLALALPEWTSRYEFALSNRLAGAAIFHGLRDLEGWKGCARSYKFLAKRALDSGFSRLLVYEDDADFKPDIADRLEVIERYLAQHESNWDIFSGLLSDLHGDANISDVVHFESEEFIHLDSVIGMVFGIYNRSALQMLSSFEFEGADTQKHTIDRYLESKRPHCVTVLPPVATHSEHLDSTLWPINNSEMKPMIENSLLHLRTKIASRLLKDPLNGTDDM